MNISKSWDRAERICLYCQQTYVPIRFWQKTCSYECGYNYQNSKKPKSVNNKACARCGNSLIHKKAHAIYCSKSCKSMDHNFKHRGKTRTYSTARRHEIYKRDGEACYLCGRTIDLSEMHLDHLIPVSRGGSGDPQNLASCCGLCNRKRGNRIDIAQLLKLAELRNQV